MVSVVSTRAERVAELNRLESNKVTVFEIVDDFTDPAQPDQGFVARVTAAADGGQVRCPKGIATGGQFTGLFADNCKVTKAKIKKIAAALFSRSASTADMNPAELFAVYEELHISPDYEIWNQFDDGHLIEIFTEVSERLDGLTETDMESVPLKLKQALQIDELSKRLYGGKGQVILRSRTPLNQKQQILDSLERFVDEFPETARNVKLVELKAVRGSYGSAKWSVNPVTGEAFVEIFLDGKLGEMTTVKLDEGQTHPAKSPMESVAWVVAHEWGHAVDYTRASVDYTGISNMESGYWDRSTARSALRDTGRNFDEVFASGEGRVTDYAATNSTELAAESFAAWATGLAELTPDIDSALSEMIERSRGV